MSVESLRAMFRRPPSKIEIPEDGQWPEFEIELSQKGRQVNRLRFPVCAFIIAPEDYRLLYFEVPASSDSLAHGIMGAVTEAESITTWRYYSDQNTQYVVLKGPLAGRCLNARVPVPGPDRRYLHHVVMIDPDSGLILAKDDRMLWEKVRDIIECPTLPAWFGRSVRGQPLASIIRKKVLIPCICFNLPEGMEAFTMATDGEAQMEKAIRATVMEEGFGE